MVKPSHRAAPSPAAANPANNRLAAQAALAATSTAEVALVSPLVEQRIAQGRKQAALEAAKYKKNVGEVKAAYHSAWQAHVMSRAAPPLPPNAASGLLTGSVPPPVHRKAPPRLEVNAAPRKVIRDEVLATRLLEGLRAAGDPSLHTYEKPVSMPVTPHTHRVPAARRGVSLAFLRAVCRFFAKHGGVTGELAHTCGGGFCDARGTTSSLRVTLSTLTAHTGLSLVESCMQHAARLGLDASPLFGRATTFISYTAQGSSLADVGTAAQRALRRLQLAEQRTGGGGARFLWLETLSASPLLASGSFLQGDSYSHGTAEHAARTEDAGANLDGPLAACREHVLYLTPLFDPWIAPASPPLDSSVGSTPRPGTVERGRGPRALRHATVLCELATTLARRYARGEASVRLLVELRPADAQRLRQVLEQDPYALIDICDSVDVQSARVDSTGARAMLAARLGAAGGGGDDAFDVVNDRLRRALKEWLVEAAIEMLEPYQVRVAPMGDPMLSGADDAADAFTSYMYAPSGLVGGLCTMLRACGRTSEAERYEGRRNEYELDGVL